MATMAEINYFASSFDRNMSAMYREAKHLFEGLEEDFPEGTGVMILTEDPECFRDYEVIEQTIGLSDEEPQYSDDDTQEEKIFRDPEMPSHTLEQETDDDLIARALRQLTEAKEKAAEPVVDEITFSNSRAQDERLAAELADHLQHSTQGVQSAIDEFGKPTQKLSRGNELPYEDVQQRTPE